ncbi:hypothetical protein [Streptomyces mayteni]
MPTHLDRGYQRLSAPAARLYRLMGLHPVPELSSDVTAAALGATSHHALEELLAADLVSELPAASGGQDRYGMLAAVHGHAAGLAEQHESQPARSAAFQRICDSYVLSAAAARAELEPYRSALPAYADPAPHAIFLGRHEALGWLRTEYPALLAVIHHDQAPGRAVYQLVSSLWPYWLSLGGSHQARSAHRLGLAAARTARDREAIGRLLTHSGLLERSTDPQHARGLLFEAVQHYTVAGDTRRAACALHHLGLANKALGRVDEARDLWWRAVADCRHQGEERTAALALTALAGLANETARHAEAAALASTAYDTLILTSPGPDPHSAALAQLQWARAEAATGNTDRARDLLCAAVETLAGLGVSRHCGLALVQLGAVHAGEGARDRALDCYRHAARLAEDRHDARDLATIQHAIDALAGLTS